MRRNLMAIFQTRFQDVLFPTMHRIWSGWCILPMMPWEHRLIPRRLNLLKCIYKVCSLCKVLGECYLKGTSTRPSGGLHETLFKQYLIWGFFQNIV